MTSLTADDCTDDIDENRLSIHITLSTLARGYYLTVFANVKNGCFDYLVLYAFRI